MTTRRQLLHAAAAVGAATALPWTISFTRGITPAEVGAATPSLTKWLDPLPIPTVLTPSTNRKYPGADYYAIPMAQGSWRFHSQLPLAPTWGYSGAGYLGKTIEARSGKQVVVTFTNDLPKTHLFASAIDPTLFMQPQGGNYPAQVRTVP